MLSASPSPYFSARRTVTRREKIWVVRAGDGETVGEIVRKAREDASAFAEGRVFIERRRVSRADEPVKPGVTVRIGPRAASPKSEEVAILFQRDDLVATVKPAGIPTVPDTAGAAHSFQAIVARRLGIAEGTLRVTSRLDRGVSGVVVFALGEAAEARLRDARASGRYERRYVALAGARPSEEAGVWAMPIGRARDPRLRAIDGPDAKPAETRWRAIAEVAVREPSAVTMLAVQPITGRTHQIRVHASHAELPLVGDRDYGGASRVLSASGSVRALGRIALHAARVVVPASSGEELVAVAPIPAELANLWGDLGGQPEAWDTAVSCRVSVPA